MVRAADALVPHPGGIAENVRLDEEARPLERRNPRAAQLDRADRALATGDVTTAAAEIAALPTTLRPRATAWLAAAERYQAGWRAMSALELMLIDPLPLAAPAR